MTLFSKSAFAGLKVILLSVLLSVCFVSAKDKLVVAVSIAPYATMLKAVAGDEIEVVTMLPPGADPHTYEPKPKVLKDFSRASVYFTDGSGMDKAWLPRFKGVNKNIKIVDVSKGVSWLNMGAHEHEGHEGKHGKHENELDPHIWTSPAQAAKVMSNMRVTLSSLMPEHDATFVYRFAKVANTLGKVGGEIKNAVLSLPEEYRTFIVFHPSYGYLARDYGLRQLTVEVNGKEPKPKDLKNLIKEGKEHNVHIVFVQPQFSKRAAETIAKELDAKVLEVNPLDSNYLENTRNMVTVIRETAEKYKKTKLTPKK